MPDIHREQVVRWQYYNSVHFSHEPFSTFFSLCNTSGLAVGLVSFLGVFMGCFIFGLNGIRRKHNSERKDISFDEEADNADLVKGELSTKKG